MWDVQVLGSTDGWPELAGVMSREGLSTLINPDFRPFFKMPVLLFIPVRPPCLGPFASIWEHLLSRTGREWGCSRKLLCLQLCDSSELLERISAAHHVILYVIRWR